MSHPFFTYHGPITIDKISELLNIKINLTSNSEIAYIKDLGSADKNSLTFLHSKKYSEIAKSTKASYCLTTDLLKDFLPKTCKPIIVENVLMATSIITSKLYPNSIEDEFDSKVNNIEKINFKNKVNFGKNVLIGSNVKIGKNCSIGHNTIIEKNVIIGDNCSIGSNTIIRNTILKNHIKVLDGCVIGKKGFGFFPKNGNNYRFPQIGIVLINDYSEIGCGSTIDRGSISNTIIGRNTYLDNQIHIAHNVKIGDNCIIAGQVGFAGSSILGNNVMIGGQAGISGHLKIGNNIKIGGGSGVIKDIPDNSRVMGYPAKDLKEFIKENK